MHKLWQDYSGRQKLTGKASQQELHDIPDSIIMKDISRYDADQILKIQIVLCHIFSFRSFILAQVSNINVISTLPAGIMC